MCSSDLIERLTSRSALQRVAAFLAGHCTGERGPISLHLPHGKGFIAARLGMEPETFSRALAKLRGHGVESRGQTVHIADMASLRRLSDPA